MKRYSNERGIILSKPPIFGLIFVAALCVALLLISRFTCELIQKGGYVKNKVSVMRPIN